MNCLPVSLLLITNLSKSIDMLGSILAVATLVAGAVSAPTKLQQRQAPSGVPDYVLKYGEYLFTLKSNICKARDGLGLHILVSGTLSGRPSSASARSPVLFCHLPTSYRHARNSNA